MRVDLCVELKTTDLVRDTARRTLSEDLRWGDCLLGLDRAELWRFRAADGDPAGFLAALEREVERGSTYYNPNKERLRFLQDPPLPEGDQLAPTEALVPCAAPGGGAWRARLWVTDEGGARADLLRIAVGRFTRAGIALESIHRGTLWTVELRASGRDEARGRVAGMALSRGRGEGLLLNPHYQEGRLMDLVERP